ncbi:hypothetical protein RND71_031879 [Anisodus tanguticus]|uniref:AP2/ERF domain-containing protein n=1 Tax=Anisodus tanguticus TaxID=243964 RepID=A0AAE1RBI7_9SOLA|nr:hypothetical protein RND71_031879 [Anisodus tanguticus]
MVQSKKFKALRQREWGSWVSEIRHPPLKKMIWLGTFETAEEAVRDYDETTILMNGQVTKTNFPIVRRIMLMRRNSPFLHQHCPLCSMLQGSNTILDLSEA